MDLIQCFLCAKQPVQIFVFQSFETFLYRSLLELFFLHDVTAVSKVAGFLWHSQRLNKLLPSLPILWERLLDPNLPWRGLNALRSCWVPPWALRLFVPWCAGCKFSQGEALDNFSEVERGTPEGIAVKDFHRYLSLGVCRKMYYLYYCWDKINEAGEKNERE